MKLALVTIVTANLEPMRTFYQQVLQLEPQIYRGNYIEFTLETGTLALWRQSECAEYGLDLARGTANDRVLIELEVADVDREYARLKGLQVAWVQELNHEDDHRDDQQEMDEASQGIGGHQTEEPQHEQDHKDRPQHGRLLWSLCAGEGHVQGPNAF